MMLISSRSTTYFWVGLLLALIAGGCTGGVAPSDASMGDSSGEDARHVAEVREVHTFQSLDEMVGTADLVIVGQVEHILPGRSVGERSPTIQFREIHLTIEEVLKGDADPGSIIVLEEEGWADGIPYKLNDMKWSEEADRGFYFLQLKAEPGLESSVYRYVSTQGRLLVDNNDRLIVPRLDDHLTQQIAEKMEAPDLRRAIIEARTHPGRPMPEDAPRPRDE